MESSSLRRSTSWAPGESSLVVSCDAASPPTAAVRPERPIRVLVISDLLLMRAGLHHVLDVAGILLVNEAGTCDEAVGSPRVNARTLS
jgi:hypothetical protein